jgi:hypothetical protein
MHPYNYMAFGVGLGPDIWSDNYILSQIYKMKRWRWVGKEKLGSDGRPAENRTGDNLNKKKGLILATPLGDHDSPCSYKHRRSQSQERSNVQNLLHFKTPRTDV